MPAYAIKLFRRSDGTVIATVPDVPAAVAYGQSDAEALASAAEALRHALDAYVSEGFEIPQPRTGGVRTIEVEDPRLVVLA